jgi:tetratricopeptide (TPR) repeat protein
MDLEVAKTDMGGAPELSSSSTEPKADLQFELGKLYRDRGDFFLAIKHLSSAYDQYLADHKTKELLDTSAMLLRLYVETEQNSKVESLRETLQAEVLKQGLELNSRTYYMLALCEFYQDRLEAAHDFFQRALQLGLKSDSKDDICYAISGLAGLYRRQKKYSEALKEIYNLQIFLQVLDLPEVKASTAVLNGVILTDLGKYDQAFDVLWQAYDYVRSNKTMLLHIYVMMHLGLAYWYSGQKDMARIHFKLAQKAVDPSNMKLLHRLVSEKLSEIGEHTDESFDLIFDLEAHSVQEKRMGRVDFKNQFILLDLLKIFVTNPGVVFSKEQLVQDVWKQTYDPAVHDNKIYVTIKRLRKLIEPDYDKPKYIFRAKNGYYMNKEARVLVESGRGVS